MKRLTPATVTFLMFGVVGLLVAAYVAKGLMATEPPKPPRTRNMPVPIADIPAGTLIVEQHLGQIPLIESTLKEGMLSRNAVIVGRVTKKALKAAEPIFGNDLYEYGVTPPLPVAKGMRAITIVAGETSSLVDVLVKPGDYIDVQFQPQNLARDPRHRGGLMVSLLKGVKILAINRQMKQGQPAEVNTLTLELTPIEASVVDLAGSHGKLTYRYNPEGKAENVLVFKDPSRITLEEILGLPEVVEAKPPVPFRAQMYRQSARQELEFSADNRVKDSSGNYVPAPPLPDRNLDPRAVPSPDDPLVPAPQQPPVDVSPLDNGVQTRTAPPAKTL